jgi:hypothetical protein
MTGRVLLGKKGSNYGLYVSRPGKEVTTVGREDLLFSSDDTRTSQVLKIIDVTLSNTTHTTVNFNGNGSSIGYIPFVLVTEIDGSNIKNLYWEYYLSYGGMGLTYDIGSKYSCKVTNSAITMYTTKYVNASATFRVLVFAIPAIDGS